MGWGMLILSRIVCQYAFALVDFLEVKVFFFYSFLFLQFNRVLRGSVSHWSVRPFVCWLVGRDVAKWFDGRFTQLKDILNVLNVFFSLNIHKRLQIFFFLCWSVGWMVCWSCLLVGPSVHCNIVLEAFFFLVKDKEAWGSKQLFQMSF